MFQLVWFFYSSWLEKHGEEISIRAEEDFLPAWNRIMKQLKLWDSIGTSLISFGSLFLHFSIFG